MNAELLLMFTLDCDRAYLYAHPERELTVDEQARYDLAARRTRPRRPRAVHHRPSGILGHGSHRHARRADSAS